MDAPAPLSDVQVDALVDRLATRIRPLCRDLPDPEFGGLVRTLVELDLLVRGFADMRQTVQDRVERRLRRHD